METNNNNNETALNLAMFRRISLISQKWMTSHDREIRKVQIHDIGLNTISSIRITRFCDHWQKYICTYLIKSNILSFVFFYKK